MYRRKLINWSLYWDSYTIFSQILIPLILLFAIDYIKKKYGIIKKDSISRFSKNFSYFFLDYDEKYYYWEFIRIFQKIIIIAVL
jgi:hypothetical protein